MASDSWSVASGSLAVAAYVEPSASTAAKAAAAGGVDVMLDAVAAEAAAAAPSTGTMFTVALAATRMRRGTATDAGGRDELVAFARQSRDPSAAATALLRAAAVCDPTSDAALVAALDATPVPRPSGDLVR